MKGSAAFQITAHIERLEAPYAETIRFLRQVILDTNQEIGEQIKWNSLSFYYTGEMKPFDPKEYKRDIMVMNLHKGKLLLVFPTGAKCIDVEGLPAVNYPDGRKIITIRDIEDAKAKMKPLQLLLKDWLSQIEKGT